MFQKRISSFLAVCLVVTLLISLSACTADNNGGETTTTTTTATEGDSTMSTITTTQSTASSSDPTSSSSVSNSVSSSIGTTTTKPDTGDVRTYYMKDATGSSDFKKLRSLINQARQENLVAEGQGKTLKFNIVFEKKTYSFDKTITLTSNDNLTFEGNGATFIMTEFCAAFNIMQSDNVTLRNFSIDYDPLPFTQGVVTAVGGGYITLKVDDGYPADPAIINRGLLMVAVHDPKTGSFVLNAPSYKEAAKAETVKDRTIRIPGEETDVFKVGAAVSLCVRGEMAITANNTANFTCENLNLYASSGGGIKSIGGYGNTVLKNVKIVPGPKPSGATKDRLISVCADASHFYAQSVGPTLDNCRFTHMQDDGINVHDFYYHILKVIDSSTIIACPTYDNDALKVGDTIELCNQYSYDKIGQARIRSMEKRYDPSYANLKAELWRNVFHWNNEGDCIYEIKLDRSIKLDRFDHFVSMGSACSGATIKNSFFGYNRAHGIVIKSPDAKILNTTVTHTAEAGIIAKASMSWSESHWANNLEISGCTVSNCALATYPYNGSEDVAAISIGASPITGHTGFLDSYGNKNIVIKNNTITDSRVMGISVVNADGVTITGNKILNPLWNGKGKVGAIYNLTADAGIFIGKAKNITITDNTVTKNNAAVKQAVQIHSTVSGSQTVSGNTLK